MRATHLHRQHCSCQRGLISSPVTAGSAVCVDPPPLSVGFSAGSDTSGSSFKHTHDYLCYSQTGIISLYDCVFKRRLDYNQKLHRDDREHAKSLGLHVNDEVRYINNVNRPSKLCTCVSAHAYMCIHIQHVICAWIHTYLYVCICIYMYIGYTLVLCLCDPEHVYILKLEYICVCACLCTHFHTHLSVCM